MLKIKSPEMEIIYISEDDRTMSIAYRGLLKGFAQSFGSLLTRVLMANIPGYAPQAYYMLNAGKFQKISGVHETTIELENNIMNLNLAVYDVDESVDITSDLILKYNAEFCGALYAKDLTVVEPFNGKVRVLNPDLVLLTSDNNVHITLQIKCGYGMYYSSANERAKVDSISNILGEDSTSKFITINSVYSPIRKAHFVVEGGSNRFTEDLVLTIETTGAVTPVEALKQALELCAVYTSLFATVDNVIGDLNTGGVELKRSGLKNMAMAQNITTEDEFVDNTKESSNVQYIHDKLYTQNEVDLNLTGIPTEDKPLEMLKLDSISFDLLKNNSINTLGQLRDKISSGEIESIINKYSNVYTGNRLVKIDVDELKTKLEEIGITSY